MKIRSDFVTNSSSSSYLVVYEIDDSPELRDFIKEEYGKWGVRMAEGYFTKGSAELKAYVKDQYGSYEADSIGDLEQDKIYVAGQKVAWSDEGDQDSPCISFVEMLPGKYTKLVYEGESG